MKFIRKNGRIIPIKDKGEKVPQKPVGIVKQKTTVSERAAQGAKFGFSSGAFLGGIAGSVQKVDAMATKGQIVKKVLGGYAKGVAIGGALGATIFAASTAIAGRREKNVNKKTGKSDFEIPMNYDALAIAGVGAGLLATRKNLMIAKQIPGALGRVISKKVSPKISKLVSLYKRQHLKVVK